MEELATTVAGLLREYAPYIAGFYAVSVACVIVFGLVVCGVVISTFRRINRTRDEMFTSFRSGRR